MIRISVDLPEPFRPSTPILAPGKKDREMSRMMCRLGGTTFATRFIVYMYCAMCLPGVTERALSGMLPDIKTTADQA